MVRALRVLMLLLLTVPSYARAQDPYVRVRQAPPPPRPKTEAEIQADSIRWANWQDPHIDDALGWGGVAISGVGLIIYAGDRTPEKQDTALLLSIVGGGFILAGLIVHESEPKKPKPRPQPSASIELRSSHPLSLALAYRFP